MQEWCVHIWISQKENKIINMKKKNKCRYAPLPLDKKKNPKCLKYISLRSKLLNKNIGKALWYIDLHKEYWQYFDILITLIIRFNNQGVNS